MRPRLCVLFALLAASAAHAQPSGAFTGDISAEMIADAGASAVIVGHSERRALHGESDADVKAKVNAAARAKLTAILCVGETKEERQADATLPRIERQLDLLGNGREVVRATLYLKPVGLRMTDQEVSTPRSE